MTFLCPFRVLFGARARARARAPVSVPNRVPLGSDVSQRGDSGTLCVPSRTFFWDSRAVPAGSWF